MACKRICSIMLAILMVSPTAITASAAEQIPTHQEQRFISSKQEMIAGIPTTVNEYECNGVIVETFRFLYKGIIINHNKNRANLH